MTEQVARASRLLQMERLLRRNTHGLTASELADQLGCSPRTIQRDLLALQGDPLRVPVEQIGRRYRVMEESYPLAPIRLTLQEARAIFLATRLLVRYADERDPDGVTALEKIAEALPDTISHHLEWTVEQLRQRPVNQHQSEVLRKITLAWATSKSIAIRYRSGGRSATSAFGLDPYLLEPSTTGAATYVVGYSHKHREVRVFKIDRIQEAVLSGEVFVPANAAEIARQLGQSWSGVVFGGDEQFDVVLDFGPGVAARVAETHWHPSQRLTGIEGGGVRLELRLPSLLEFVPWVRSWGAEVKVVAPEDLRTQVAESMRAAAALYAER